MPSSGEAVGRSGGTGRVCHRPLVIKCAFVHSKQPLALESAVALSLEVETKNHEEKCSLFKKGKDVGHPGGGWILFKELEDEDKDLAPSLDERGHHR
eukprot:CAMPEP_0175989490 /NCGR_PEP_ID=MMETSP0108-20121206/51794_1 /TAXON_ID=195067 ORGANISM="Goniomonas pacifica, Strain CCMP1869" /NCGR_SAMPLE_ID=MMETSP0108 /ASSEMBLY_ACC=CAM_ASM_000204 /LENGTH=96 /DNA_ID=CAMNT_0017320885 /DNA_START=37 /DNA_END=327 /DNA_ORIENTATION=+